MFVSIRSGLYGALFLTISSTRSARTNGLPASCLNLSLNTLSKDTFILPGLQKIKQNRFYFMFASSVAFGGSVCQ